MLIRPWSSNCKTLTSCLVFFRKTNVRNTQSEKVFWTLLFIKTRPIYYIKGQVLIACPFFRVSSCLLVWLGRLVDLSRAHTLFSSLCPSSPISSVSLDTSGERVGPPAAQSSLTFGWPPFNRRENTPTPSLLQHTEIDGGMEGATGGMKQKVWVYEKKKSSILSG